MLFGRSAGPDDLWPSGPRSIARLRLAITLAGVTAIGGCAPRSLQTGSHPWTPDPKPLLTQQPSPAFDPIGEPGGRPETGEIAIRPVVGSTEAFPAFSPPAEESRSGSADLGERLALRRTERQRRSGEASTGALSPSIRTSSVGRETPADLRDRREQLLEDLSRYATRSESDLGDGERLAKHRIQMQLMALHFLAPDDPRQLEPLIDSLDDPVRPSRAHSLLRASFYESVGLERESAAVLAEVGGERGLERATPGRAGFRVAPPVLCSRIELYAEVFGMTNGAIGSRFRQSLLVVSTLIDRDGREHDLGSHRASGDPSEEEVLDSFLNVNLSIPRQIALGAGTLQLTVTDLISGDVSKQQLDLQIEP
jgi:hypothetical protein